MTEPFDEYDDRLRLVLNAEADAVVPSAEGLEKIRARIDESRERRLWYVRPWLRPLAALSAAIVMAVIAVPATDVFKNFVQTGHLSTQADQGPGRRVPDGQRPRPAAPNGPSPGDTRVAPRPSAGQPTSPGDHVLTSSCPPSQQGVTPSVTPNPVPSAIAPSPEPSDSTTQVTCQPGADTLSPSPHVPGLPSDSSTNQSRASQLPDIGSPSSPQPSP